MNCISIYKDYSYNIVMKKRAFIIIELVIYISFMISDIFNGFETTNIKYIGIILCLLYSLFNKSKNGIIAFVLTLEADYYLLIKDDNYSIGIFFFILTQLFYAYYLNKNNIKTYLPFRIIIPIIFMIFIKPLNLTNILVSIYFPQLLINCLSSIQNKKQRLLTYGFILFVLCDIFVGMHNIEITNKYYALAQWFFYLPSQVLIALSLN